MASRNEYEMLFKLSAQLGQNFNGTFSSAQKTLAATQKEIQSLNKLQSDISSYTKQQQSVDALKNKLSTYRQQLQNVQKEIAASGEYSSELANKELDLKQKVEQTEASLKQKTETLHQMGDSLSKAGVDTANLSKETKRLGESINDLKTKEEKAAEEAEQLGNAGAGAMDAISGAVIASGALSAVKALYNEFTACIDAAIEFESTMTGVAKTTDFSSSELETMSQEIRKLSLEIPATTKELGAISETAGQLGIAKQDLLEFTEIMAQLGTATNMTSEEAATMLAQFASITGMDPSYYGNLGSAIVALGNSYATTEKNIAQMSQTVAAAGSIAGMSEADILAISAAVTSLGISAQNGGTQMTKLISDINSAVSSGEDLEAWAAVANMSASEFASAWGNDAAGALNAFIVGLNESYESGEDVYSILSDLGISETRMVTMITSLAKSGDRLTETLATSGAAWQENSALTEEAEKRYATTESQLTLLSNSYNDLRTTIGEMFTPELKGLAEVGAKILQGINDFAEENPVLVKSIVAITVEVGTLVAAYGAYAGIKKTVNGIKAISAALTAKETVATGAQTAATVAQTSATEAATVAQTGLNVAMSANPIGLILTAVSAATVGIIGLVSVISDASKKEKEASEQLTLASQKQKKELEAMNAEYERTCELYGETSYQAQELSWELKELQEEYESNAQTMAEYRDEFDESISSYYEMVEEHEKAIAEVQKESASILSLVYRLDELTQQTDIAASEQQEILAIIRALNSEVPGLSLSYDQLSNKLSLSTDALMSLVDAEIASRKYEQYYESLVQKVSARSDLKTDLQTAIENQTAAQEKYNAKVKEYEKWYEKHKNSLNSTKNASKMGTYWAEINELAELYNEFTEDVNQAQTAIDGNERAIEILTNMMAGLNDTTEEATDSESELTLAVNAVYRGYMTSAQAAAYYKVSVTNVESKIESLKNKSTALAAALKAVREGFMNADEAAQAFDVTIESLGAYRQITEITDEITALSEAYGDAYSEAYKSISGQYKLWDKAAEVIPEDIDAINAALETQTAYWYDYNVDLQSLKDRSADIEGLTDVIADFSDGSKESVNVVAGMAHATDEDLRLMVKNWQKLQAEEKNASESLSQMDQDYATTLDDLQNQLAQTIEDFDLSEEAKAAAEATMNAYITALQEGADEAATIAQQLATQVGTSLNTSSDSSSGGTANSGGGESSAGESGESGTATVSQEEMIAVKIVKFGDASGRGMNASKSGDNGIVSWGGKEYKVQNSGNAYGSSTPLYKAAVEVLGFGDRQIFGYNGKIYGYLDGHIQELEGRTLSSKGYDKLASDMSANYGTYHTGGLVGDVATLSESEEFAKLLKGEFVSTPTQMKHFMEDTLPQIAEYKAETVVPATEAQSSQNVVYTVTIAPTFTMQGVENDNMEDKFRECGDLLVDMVVDKLEEMGIDAKRGAYV